MHKGILKNNKDRVSKKKTQLLCYCKPVPPVSLPQVTSLTCPRLTGSGQLPPAPGQPRWQVFKVCGQQPNPPMSRPPGDSKPVCH